MPPLREFFEWYTLSEEEARDEQRQQAEDFAQEEARARAAEEGYERVLARHPSCNDPEHPGCRYCRPRIERIRPLTFEGVRGDEPINLDLDYNAVYRIIESMTEEQRQRIASQRHDETMMRLRPAKPKDFFLESSEEDEYE